MSLRRPTCALALALMLIPAADAAAQSEGALPGKLGRAMRSTSAASGAYVVNADTGKVVFRFRHTRPRVLASNTKLYTTAAALARFGVEGRLDTEVRGVG